jgi:hypothetical protein
MGASSCSILYVLQYRNGVLVGPVPVSISCQLAVCCEPNSFVVGLYIM